MSNSVILIILALLAGAFVPAQTGANALLSKHLGNGMLATLVVFMVATLVTIAILLLQRPAIPVASLLTAVPLYAWITGGLLGAAYIFLLIFLAPKLGMTSVVGLVIVGQLVMAVIFDHFGWMGFTIHAINWQRLLGCGLMLVGLYLIKKF